MVETKLHWKFPAQKIFFMKLEVWFLFLLAIIIFIFTYLGSENQFFSALIFTLLFIGLYVLLSYLIQRIRLYEEHYHLTKTRLEINRKSRTKVKHEDINLKDVKHHKLDKFFHGGYILTNKGKKHQLFFNNRKEVVKFETLLKKYLAPFKKKGKK